MAIQSITMIPLNKIMDFPNHPFVSRHEDALRKLAHSIAQNGVLEPVLLMPMDDHSNRYYCISGHRRREACACIGKQEIPAIIKEYSMDEATIIMASMNFHKRESIPPSETAKACAMMHAALKRKAGRPSGPNTKNTRQVGARFRTVHIIGEILGKSGRQIERLLRLNKLSKSLLAYVDAGKIKHATAYELSFLSEDAQCNLSDIMEIDDTVPSLKQAKQLRELDVRASLDYDALREALCAGNNVSHISIKFPANIIERYIGDNSREAPLERILCKSLAIYAAIGDFFSDMPTPLECERAREAIGKYKAFLQKKEAMAREQQESALK